MKYISSLDGLRGAAALLVVLFHYFPRTSAGPFGVLASFGWMGVDIFFVLSGFLITSILYEQRGAEHYFRNFYMRRLLRLSPLYYALFAVVLLLTPWLHIHWRPLQWAIFFYGANIVLPLDDSLAQIGPFQVYHLWSLAIEEQFYLIWPWILGSRLSKESLKKICVVGIVAALLLRLVMLHAHVYTLWIYQSLPSRMDALLMGALLALIPRPSLRTAKMAGFAGLLVFGATVAAGHSAFFQSRPIQGLGYSALGVLAASILTMNLYPATIASRIFSWKILRFYGRYSYGLYLWHYFFLQQYGALKLWVSHRVGSPRLADAISFLLMFLGSTLIAVASYWWIEQPFLRLKHRFASPGTVPALSGDGQEFRGGEALEPKLQTAPGLDGVEHNLVIDGVLGGPA